MKQLFENLESLFNIVLTLFGMSCLVLVVLDLGFHLTPQQEQMVRWGVHIVAMFFIVQELFRWIPASNMWEHLKNRWFDNILALTLFGVILAETYLVSQFQESGDFLQEVILIYIGVTQLIGFLAQLIRYLRSKEIFERIEMDANRLFVISFVFPILLGTLLLKLPRATVEGISWLDALFTSTSAVCVTGLVVLDTGADFTVLGQTIICLLFQIGGLGIMTLTMSFGILFSGGLGVKERTVLGDMLSERRLGSVGTLLFRIAIFTLSIEFIGALLLYFGRQKSMAFVDWKLIGDSVFHAISAFCNAGFSLYSKSLADPSFQNQIFSSYVIMALIVLGGMGFPVVSAIIEWLRARRRSWYSGKIQLSINSKLVLWTTAILLVSGTVMFLLLEKDRAFASLSWLEKIRQSLFLSVTSRTAGFNLWPTEALSIPAGAFLLFLMWIGGSPMSTAGGVKTLTVAVAAINFRAFITGHPRLEVFNRQLGDISVKKSYAIIVGSVMTLFFACLALLFMEPHIPHFDLIFEAVSAYGTVGLSRGITSDLSNGGKAIIIVLMFVGRLGIVNVLGAIWSRERRRNYRLLVEDVVIS